MILKKKIFLVIRISIVVVTVIGIINHYRTFIHILVKLYKLT